MEKNKPKKNFLVFLLTYAIIFRPSVISLRDFSVYSGVLYQFCAFKNIDLFF